MSSLKLQREAAGELRAPDAGTRVLLKGWVGRRRDLGEEPQRSAEPPCSASGREPCRRLPSLAQDRNVIGNSIKGINDLTTSTASLLTQIGRGDILAAVGKDALALVPGALAPARIRVQVGVVLKFEPLLQRDRRDDRSDARITLQLPRVLHQRR